MANETLTVDLDAILDGTLDGLADAPTFEPYRPGGHKVTINWEGIAKKLVINKHPTIKLKMKLIETIELANQSDTAQAPGSESEVLFMMDNEMGQGLLKNVLKSLGEHYTQAKNNREIFEASEGAECLVVTSIRENKEKGTKYTDLKEIRVL